MFVSFSFANGLCLVLIAILVFELCQRDNEVNSSPGASESNDLEWTYCKNPLIEPTRRNPLTCTSTRQLFVTLANDCARTRTRKLVLTQSASQSTITDNKPDKNCSEVEYRRDGVDSITLDVVRINDDDDEDEDDDGDEDEDESRERQDELAEIREAVLQHKKESKTTSLADTIVVALLVLLAAVSIRELYKETIARHSQGGENGGSDQPGHEGGRRLSLADLTVMRHTRRRESQQMDQQFRKSINTTGKRPPPLLRRSSFPAQLLAESHHRHMPQRQQSWSPNNQAGIIPSRRMSMDMSEDDSSPDRRRVRIIRRH